MVECKSAIHEWFWAWIRTSLLSIDLKIDIMFIHNYYLKNATWETIGGIF